MRKTSPSLCPCLATPRRISLEQIEKGAECGSGSNWALAPTRGQNEKLVNHIDQTPGVILALLSPLFGQAVGNKEIPITTVKGESWISHLHKNLVTPAWARPGIPGRLRLCQERNPLVGKKNFHSILPHEPDFPWRRYLSPELPRDATQSPATVRLRKSILSSIRSGRLLSKSSWQE